MTAGDYWNGRYAAIGAEAVSWYESTPATSVELIRLVAGPDDSSVLDVGGGASRLCEALLASGFGDVSVLDVSRVALDAACALVGGDRRVAWIEADVLRWTPARTWDVWHDRAVLHFLTNEEERARYVGKLAAAVAPGGGFVIGTFAEDGPDQCSGLPVRRHSIQELIALVPHADVIETRRQIHSTPGGAEQPFNWIAARLR